MLRIKVAADGSYTVPAGNLFPESEDADGKTRPEIYAMGFRNPFRIQVDETTSPTSPTTRPTRRRPQRSAARPAPAGWRSCASRPTTAGRCATARPSLLPVELQHARLDARRAVRVRQPDARAGEHLALEHRPASVDAADHQARTSGTRSRTTPPAAGHAVPRVLQHGPARHLPAALPRARRPAASARTARRSTTTTRPTRADQVPAVLRRRDLLRRVHARLPEGDPARRGTARSSRSTTLLNCGARRIARRSRSCATTRWTCSSGPTATSTC